MNFRRLSSPFQLAFLVLMINTYYALAECKPLITKEGDLVQAFNTLFERYKTTVKVQAIKDTYFTKSKNCMEDKEIKNLIEALNGAFDPVTRKEPYVVDFIDKLVRLKNNSKSKAGLTTTIDSSAFTVHELKELIAKFNTVEEKIEIINQRIESAEQKLDIILGALILFGVSSITLSLRQVTKNPSGRSSRKKSEQSVENNEDQTPISDPKTTDDAEKQSNTFKTATLPAVAEAKASDKIVSKANPERISEKQALDTEPQAGKIPESIKLGTKFFYLSTPTQRQGQATFIDQRSNEFDPTSSFYKFSLIPDDTDRAYFCLVDDPDTVRSALEYPGTYLKPACKYDSNFDYNAKQIITDRPGIAELKNSVWKIVQKAQIRTV